ncbi:MAG: polymer-forming cytoskeletal protein [Proteobacteria bacterium]|nr:polymer-forming cytoskeletal protein [Pseudomonadota bacterium]
MDDTHQRRMRDHASSQTTLISEGCKISGLITGTSDVLVNGEIEGECDLSGTVTLARNGRWIGTIRAHNIIIAGHVEGDIISDGKIEITDTAKIDGTVSGEAIAVAEGAIVEGVMKTTGVSDPLNFTEKRSSDD